MDNRMDAEYDAITVLHFCIISMIRAAIAGEEVDESLQGKLKKKEGNTCLRGIDRTTYCDTMLE